MGPEEQLHAIESSLGSVIRGKSAAIRTLLAAILGGGHVLLEDVPGTGKTMLARALAGAIGLEFKRIQFTADLLPSDVTGGAVYNPREGSFSIRKGPVFAQLVLADEINRANPKVQSALLECMEEGHVTLDGSSLPLPTPFLVIATQNPIEMAGTYPLPEAQLDRFAICTGLGYPDAGTEAALIEGRQQEHAVRKVRQVITAADLQALQKKAGEVHIAGPVAAYITEIMQRTRRHPELRLGASPRATLALARTSRALSFLIGRDYVEPSVIRELAPVVLQHRVRSKLAGKDKANRAIAEILDAVKAPT